MSTYYEIQQSKQDAKFERTIVNQHIILLLVQVSIA